MVTMVQKQLIEVEGPMVKVIPCITEHADLLHELHPSNPFTMPGGGWCEQCHSLAGPIILSEPSSRHGDLTSGCSS